LQRGRLEPATHTEAAARLSYHPNSVREALYDVWSRMFAAGIPIPDISDKRIAVVEAIRINGLLRPEAGGAEAGGAETGEAETGKAAAGEPETGEVAAGEPGVDG
jgi:hypothetical protein